MVAIVGLIIAIGMAKVLLVSTSTASTGTGSTTTMKGTRVAGNGPYTHCH